jgi:hypothetical protein
VGRGDQTFEDARALPRAAALNSGPALFPDLEASFGDAVDYELLRDEEIASRRKYLEMARGYKALAAEAWLQYRRATELEQLCKAKARDQNGERLRDVRVAAFDEALRLS